MTEYTSKETAKEIVFDKIINNIVEDQGMYGYLVHLVNEAFDEAPAADVRSTEYCKECRAALLETIDHYKQLCADVRPVVLCVDCKYNNACLTQAFVEEASRIPFDRSTFFCADGNGAGNA